MAEKSEAVLGIDFGTDSVRALIVHSKTGEILGQGSALYARWANQEFCLQDEEAGQTMYRQHPLDYIESLEKAVRLAGKEAGRVMQTVRACGIDTTGSTPAMADSTGNPLALQEAFAADPQAMFILWKDHTSIEESKKINALAHSWKGPDITSYSGGNYSAEWFWAKALRVVSRYPHITKYARTIIEHCDWIPALLTGTTDLSLIKRSRCAAGHKAMWHASWNGYPSLSFLQQLHPNLAQMQEGLGQNTYTSDQVFGRLCPMWAEKLGLPKGIVIAVGALDAHCGALGAHITEGTLVKIMGTSTCDIIVGPAGSVKEKIIQGICGQVQGSVIPGLIGYEAGQSAFGDVLAWFVRLLGWCDSVQEKPSSAEKYSLLEEAAGKLPVNILRARAVVALDWFNGRRSPDANNALRAAIMGLSLDTDAPALYKGLLEALAFGARAITERLTKNGLEVKKILAVGGVAQKSPLLVQICADVFGQEIALPSSNEPCALGAAIYAATAAGMYKDVVQAADAMCPPISRTYFPCKEYRDAYDALYAQYLYLGGCIAGA